VSVEVDYEVSPQECKLLAEQGTDLKDVKLTVPTDTQGEKTITGVQAEAFSFVTTGGSTCWSKVIPTPNGKLYTVCK
jgi:hypothetical protein